ncbi:hypothetical protein HOY34_20045 [Xinfangfangia sp. D13-10-4-6]|uniref:hypothetical protein n=1 Tax=Pseudogemmobacter hezensis TaxID=2737662 RepID=UPI001551CB7F|nr:hypothetical protein [Pseudogemmobacter hezensis]NPD17481.1 hypothetical protein [Pseudogemmobacter hezensis]
MSDCDQSLAEKQAGVSKRALEGLRNMLKGLSGVSIVFASAAAVLLKLLADSYQQPELQRLELSIFILGMFVFFGISFGWLMFWLREMIDDATKHSEGRWRRIGWNVGKTATAIGFIVPISIVSWGAFGYFKEFSDSLKAFRVHTLDRIEENAAALDR